MPDGLFLGTARDTLDVIAMTDEAVAMHWLAAATNRQLWKVRVDVIHELVYVPPGTGSLVPRDEQAHRSDAE